MADQVGNKTEDGQSPDGGRPRAPTITINTTNIDGPDPNEPTTESPTKRVQSHSRHSSHISIPEERDSRPASPHNVSSPVSRGGEKSFLAVPGQRSRQNSIESEEGNQSTTLSGETFTNNSKDSPTEKQINNDEIMHDSEALTPDPGHEQDFKPEDNSFAFSIGQLNKLINPKSLGAFYALGGLAGLEKGLRTDRKTGLSVDEGDLEGTVTFEQAQASARQNSKTNGNGYDKEAERVESKSSTPRASGKDHDSFYDRKRIFSDNRLPVKKGKTIWELMWITYNDKVLILLSVAAVISLAVGLYQTFGGEHKDGGAKLEWVEGVAIVVAILVVVIVGSANDFQKERQFVKLNSKKQDRDVKVIRSGKSIEISVFDVLVGDIMHLEPGDMIPVDGIFIEGHNVKCDESQTTGESDLLKKQPADVVYAAIENHEELKKMDPFILSGAQVTEGVGTFIVTSTGVNSSYGKTMMSLREDPEVTPLQSKLNTLAEYIAKLGGAAGLILFTVLFIKFLAHLPKNKGSPSEKGQEFLNIFIVTVTIIVVAVPEGLPLAVTLALAFATTRMLKDNNLVRHLKACEVMGNATAICSDKTGTLTQNKMLVVAGTVGTTARFGGAAKPQALTEGQHDESTEIKGKQNVSDNDEDTAQGVVSGFTPEIKSMLVQSIATNSTAFEGEVEGVKTFIGSKTETALLTFARDYLGMGSVDQEKSNAKIVQMIPFDSGRKCMGVIIELGDGTHRLYVKGASEILLGKCSAVLTDPTTGVESTDITEDSRQTLLGLIESYAERSLRTIGIVYKDFQQWPPKGAKVSDGDVKFEDIFKNMILLGIVGIQDPLREGVPEAVAVCQKAGVVVRMVTGDNLVTARAIATECGIYTPGGVIMEGPAFRKLSKPQMDQIIPRLQVLARSSPEDKRILVKRLKELGETVAVTGDGTNDAPALKTADVGFSMGIAGTEVAKEASAIILMDDNFNSIVKAMAWGRAVNDAVRKFLQFQITVNITAVLLTFISSVSSDSETSVLTAVQLLWVNLIMDTMAALALATDPPGPTILDRKPDPKSARLISATMWKMIFGQAIYQLVVTLVLYFAGASILRYRTPEKLAELPTLVFNTFVWMQIFNQWNNRRLDNNFNIFEGVTRNYFFMGINVIMIGAQVMIVYVGGAAFNVKRLDGKQWGISLVLGVLSIPAGALIRCIPDPFLIRLTPKFLKKRRKNGPQLTISDEEEGQFKFPQPLADVKDELTFLRKFKGGRVNNLRFKAHQVREQVMPRSRSGSRSRDNSHPGTPNHETDDDKLGTPAPPTPESRRRSRSSRSRSNSALGATTVMAGIIAGSVAGWSPIERREGDTDATRWPKGANIRADLDGRKDIEIHPDTKANDPVIVAEPPTGNLPPSQIPELRPEAGATLKHEEEKK